MQKVRATQDANRTFSAVFHINDKKLTQLADETMAQVTTPRRTGAGALGSDDRQYRILVGYEQGNYSDYYLVNTDNGSRKPLLTKQLGSRVVVAQREVRGCISTARTGTAFRFRTARSST